MSVPSLGQHPRIVAALIAILLAAAIAAQTVRLRAYPPEEEQDRFLYIQSGETAKRLALSYDALAADLFWMRVLQHYGGDRLSKTRTRKFELLYPLLDLTTTLDPQFNIAYRFGAIFLSQAYPIGAGRPDLAVALLEKGLRAQPLKWEYMHDAAFVYYWDVGDFRTAAEWFRRASQVPGAPNWLVNVAANTYALGGDRASSRFLWQQYYESAQDRWMKQDALRRLQQLDALDQIDALSNMVAAWARAHPGRQVNWRAMIATGALRGIPIDPTGTPYAIAERDVKVELSPESSLMPLPHIPATARRRGTP